MHAIKDFHAAVQAAKELALAVYACAECDAELAREIIQALSRLEAACLRLEVARMRGARIRQPWPGRVMPPMGDAWAAGIEASLPRGDRDQGEAPCPAA
ncbi:MAG: hypothetical protein KKE73_08230 [Proteobacteria bacterium]|nr:hypothetical protein [Pseudomonadota bacterium]